jgi:CHASE2 domain-containing sensor protein
MFKPVPGGYVVCEPYRLPFTQSPHYLVNEVQKDQILAMIVPKRPILWQIALGGTICVMGAVAGIAVWPYTRHGDPALTDIIGMLVLILVMVFVAFMILRWWKLRGLRPLLASLQTTDLKITRSDM